MEGPLKAILLLELVPSFVQGAKNRCTDHPLLGRGVCRDLGEAGSQSLYLELLIPFKGYEAEMKL